MSRFKMIDVDLDMGYSSVCQCMSRRSYSGGVCSNRQVTFAKMVVDLDVSYSSGFKCLFVRVPQECYFEGVCSTRSVVLWVDGSVSLRVAALVAERWVGW